MSKAPSKARRTEVKTSPARAKSTLKTVEKSVDDNTIKATFYLTQDTVNGLEDAWLQLRRASDAAQRGGITKSLIVRLALEMALEDIAAKGQSSQIAKRLDQRGIGS